MAKEPKYYGNANKSGVYQIKNLINGRIYVGRASRFKGRWSTHLSSLRNNKHHNGYLQNDWNKFGEEVFQFEVIEVVEKTSTKVLAEAEQKHIDRNYKLGREHCYNLDKIASHTDPSVFSYNPDRTRELKSKASKEMWKSAEYRKRFVRSQKKNWKENPERRKKQSKRMQELHQQPGYTKEIIKKTIANRDEEVSRNTKIKNKLLFLTERKEAVTEERDWLGPDVSRSKIYEEANLISPNGILFKKIRNLNAFAKEHDIKDSWKLQEVVELKRWQYKGWVKFLDIEDIKNFKSSKELLEYCKKKEHSKSRKIKPKAKIYDSLVDPNGKVYRNITNVPTFAKKHGLTKTSLYDVLNGKRKSHKGWKKLPKGQRSIV